MNIHENARTCPHSRRLIAQRRDQGWSRAAVAEAFGISERMVTHWHQRYQREGEAGLRDRTSAPGCHPPLWKSSRLRRSRRRASPTRSQWVLRDGLSPTSGPPLASLGA